jgi:hypothetical protein
VLTPRNSRAFRAGASSQSIDPYGRVGVGRVISSDKTYRLNAVVEPGQEYELPSGYPYKDPYAYATGKTFFHPEQKFQIVDISSNAVLAEIQHSSYTLYDAVVETERDAMKCNIGLFYAFLEASRKTSGGLSW